MKKKSPVKHLFNYFKIMLEMASLKFEIYSKKKKARATVFRLHFENMDEKKKFLNFSPLTMPNTKGT